MFKKGKFYWSTLFDCITMNGTTNIKIYLHVNFTEVLSTGLFFLPFLIALNFRLSYVGKL